MWAYLESPSLTGLCLKALLWNIATDESLPHLLFFHRLFKMQQWAQTSNETLVFPGSATRYNSRKICFKSLPLLWFYGTRRRWDKNLHWFYDCFSVLSQHCLYWECERLLVLFFSVSLSFLTHQRAPGGSTGNACKAGGKVCHENVLIQIVLSFLF